MGEINFFELDIKANTLIKEHRKSMGLETPLNRIDQGDLRMLMEAFKQMGFRVMPETTLKTLAQSYLVIDHKWQDGFGHTISNGTIVSKSELLKDIQKIITEEVQS